MSRLVTDAANRLHTTEKTVFFRAAKLEGDYDIESRWRWMWAAYLNGSIPKLAEDYCLDVLSGRKPVLHDPPSEASRRPSPFSKVPIQ